MQYSYSLFFDFQWHLFLYSNDIMGIIAHDSTGGSMVPLSLIFCRCNIQTEKAFITQQSNKYLTKWHRFHTIRISKKCIFRQTVVIFHSSWKVYYKEELSNSLG